MLFMSYRISNDDLRVIHVGITASISCNLPLTAASEYRPSLPMTHGDPRMSNVKQRIQSPTLHPVYIHRLSHRTTCKTSFSNSLLTSDDPSKSETRIQSSLSL